MLDRSITDISNKTNLMKVEILKINKKKQTIFFKLQIHSFKEGAFEIVYIPSLEISGYGETKAEAMELMKTSLFIFGENILKSVNHKITEDLKELGWEQHSYFKKQLNNISNTTFDDIKRQFNIPDNVNIQKTPFQTELIK